MGGDRDAGLLLDMLQAAREARQFLDDMDEAGFMVSRLHQPAEPLTLVEAVGRLVSDCNQPNHVFLKYSARQLLAQPSTRIQRDTILADYNARCGRVPVHDDEAEIVLRP